MSQPDSQEIKVKPLTSFGKIEVALEPGQGVATRALLTARLARDHALYPNHTGNLHGRSRRLGRYIAQRMVKELPLFFTEKVA
jgi:hypothetical protein